MRMLKLLAVLCIAALLAAPAFAAKVYEKPLTFERGMLDCSGAIPIACGDVVTGDNTGLTSNVDAYSCTSWNESAGEVVYELVLTGETIVTGTISDLGADLDIFFLGSCEEADCLDYGNTSFTSDCVPAGTYYIVVDGYGGAESSFTLTVECETCVIPDPPVNPTCETAIDLQEQGLATFVTNTCLGGNDYSPTNSCTGYSQAAGEDIVYKIFLTAGETFTVDLTDEDYDASIYMLTDCADMNSCVAGGDDPESFTYLVEADGWYYLIVDGYGSGYCGTATVTIDSPVADTPQSWGAVKELYR